MQHGLCLPVGAPITVAFAPPRTPPLTDHAPAAVFRSCTHPLSRPATAHALLCAEAGPRVSVHRHGCRTALVLRTR